jgi:hypothetical protein
MYLRSIIVYYNQTKAAQERMLEMRQLIRQRKSECPQDRPHSVIVSNTRSRVSDTPRADDFAHSMDELFSEADKELARAITNHDVLQTDLRQLTCDFKEVCSCYVYWPD